MYIFFMVLPRVTNDYEITLHGIGVDQTFTVMLQNFIEKYYYGSIRNIIVPVGDFWVFNKNFVTHVTPQWSSHSSGE
jgi:hypothetical protein